MRDSKSSFQYLRACSQTSLEAFELSRYNRVANLRKELCDLVEEWVEAEVDARFARWIREQKQAELSNRTATTVSVPDLSKCLLADTVSHVVLNPVLRLPSHPPFEEFEIPFPRTSNHTAAAFCRDANNLPLFSSRDSALASWRSCVFEQCKMFRSAPAPFFESLDSQLVCRCDRSKALKLGQSVARLAESNLENPEHRDERSDRV
ncbi:MAG: hypothetical protein WBC04_13100 [Candidatus Acidiferrales bacterium]